MTTMNLNPFSWLFARGAAEGLADGLVGRLVQGAWNNGGKEVASKVFKEKMPKFAGVGITDEEKWGALLTGLNLKEVEIITKVKDALLITKPNTDPSKPPKLDHRHQDRWRLVVTSMDVDGLMHRIEKPYREYKKTTDKGKSETTLKTGTDVKEVPVRMTESDPRLKHFRQVVAIVESYAPDEAAGIQKATEFLHTHFLNDTDFFERMVAWVKVQATASKEALKKAGSFVAKQTFELEWLLVEAAIGEAAFVRIVANPNTDEAHKKRVLEEALAMTVADKHNQLKQRRGLPRSFWVMVTLIPGIILATAIIIHFFGQR